MKVNAVFQGGGVKGIGFVGAICRMEREGYEWVNIAGTSAGAIIASLLAVGYSGIELKKIMSELDYSKLLYKDVLQSVPVFGKTLGIMFDKGYYKTRNIEKWLTDLYKSKGKTKFKDVASNNKSRLKIIASDVTKRNMIIFPDGLADYGLDPFEFEIARAVSMSICIPIFFSPKVLEYSNGKSFVVDGGIYSNFPIWIFDNDHTATQPTIGFKFDVEETKLKHQYSPFAYFIDLFESIIETVDENYIDNKNNIKILTIPAHDIKSTHFNISPSETQKLFLSGYNSANNFLNSYEYRKHMRNYKAQSYINKC